VRARRKRHSERRRRPDWDGERRRRGGSILEARDDYYRPMWEWRELLADVAAAPGGESWLTRLAPLGGLLRAWWIGALADGQRVDELTLLARAQELDALADGLAPYAEVTP
jgi:hypothetical protein